MRRLVLLLIASCSATPSPGSDVDARIAAADAPIVAPDAAPPGLPPPIMASDFDHALDKAYIRGLQTWIDDATFETKWTTMLTTKIELLGGADSAFHADLASRHDALPGGEVLCHGDPKLDNFGWTLADGHGVFSDNDFDDAGACPAAADILHFLVATDLSFADPQLTSDALDAYVASLSSPSPSVTIDPATEPVWSDVRTKGLAKATSGDAIVLGGEVQAATAEEIAAMRALATADPRFPTSVLDVVRDVHTDGGSAGLRRFWLLVEDATHPRTILELKELTTPGTEFGPHSATHDGDDRFDVLKPYWWNTAALDDHFTVHVLGGRFVVRERYTRTNPKASKLTAPQLHNMILSEAALLGSKHKAAWASIDPAALRAWLAASAATLTARWTDAYTADGGT